MLFACRQLMSASVVALFQGPKTPEMKNKNKVFLGGLPANVTETIIREAFEQFGVVRDSSSLFCVC